MNKLMRIHDLEFELYIPEHELQERVQSMATELQTRFGDRNPVFILILNGAFLFGADLVRAFQYPCEIRFFRVKSYEGTHSGEIREFSGINYDLTNRHVLIIEDIVDTGKTMFYLLDEIRKYPTTSLTTVALLQKNINRPYLVKADMSGFEIPDVFVVGYGLDYRETGRNLKDIWKVV